MITPSKTEYLAAKRLLNARKELHEATNAYMSIVDPFALATLEQLTDRAKKAIMRYEETEARQQETVKE